VNQKRSKNRLQPKCQKQGTAANLGYVTGTQKNNPLMPTRSTGENSPAYASSKFNTPSRPSRRSTKSTCPLLSLSSLSRTRASSPSAGNASAGTRTPSISFFAAAAAWGRLIPPLLRPHCHLEQPNQNVETLKVPATATRPLTRIIRAWSSTICAVVGLTDREEHGSHRGCDLD
jgi:hypothetical protein